MSVRLSEGIVNIEIEKIAPNPLAERLEVLDIDELSKSIAIHGQLSPIRVRRDPSNPLRYQVIFGHRRLLALKAIGSKYATAEVVEASDEEMIVFALAENLERDNYTDYEKALLIEKLYKHFGKSVDEIAKMLAKSKSYVSQHLSMAHLFDGCGISSEEASKVLLQLTERHARILMRVADPKERYHLAKICIAEKLGIKETERLVGHPREIIRLPESTKKNWRRIKEKAETEIELIIRNCLEGLAKKDLSPLLSVREPKFFSLYDDFPPLMLLDYDKAASHNSAVITHTEDFSLTYDSLKIYVFSGFAYSTFLVTYKMRYTGKWYMMRSRVTFIFMRKNNTWVILHEHWSPAGYENLFGFRNINSEREEAEISLRY
jgi:ParB family chromosome partitioning protein